MEAKYSEGVSTGAGLKKNGAKAKSGAKSLRKEIPASNNNDICNNGDEDDDLEDLQAEADWEALKHKKNQGEIRVSNNPVAKEILRGFRINHMRMKDAETGREKWFSGNWGKEMFQNEMVARVPASILECRAVTREINFSSEEEMENFRLEQRVFFQGVMMEEWFFTFGFVIPGSTNNWEQTIYAAEKSAMLPAQLLSGNVTIETSFYDGDLFVSKSLVRVFYDAPER